MARDHRVVYTPTMVRQAFARMRDQLAEMHSRHLGEMADLRRELDGLRTELEHLRELRDAVVARQRAEHEVAELHRQRELTRAWASECVGSVH